MGHREVTFTRTHGNKRESSCSLSYLFLHSKSKCHDVTRNRLKLMSSPGMLCISPHNIAPCPAILTTWAIKARINWMLFYCFRAEGSYFRLQRSTLTDGRPPTSTTISGALKFCGHEAKSAHSLSCPPRVNQGDKCFQTMGYHC